MRRAMIGDGDETARRSKLCWRHPSILQSWAWGRAAVSLLPPPGHGASVVCSNSLPGHLNNKSVLSENLGNHLSCSCNELLRHQMGCQLVDPCVQTCPTLDHSSHVLAAAGLSFCCGYHCDRGTHVLKPHVCSACSQLKSGSQTTSLLGHYVPLLGH